MSESWTTALWAPWSGPGLEHLRVTSGQPIVEADGVVLGMVDNEPFRFHYRIGCDASGRSRRLLATVLSDRVTARVDLHSEEEGRWRDAGGSVRPEIDGCLDLDIAVTPFTNTLAIQRLDLAVGESAAIEVAYVVPPHLEISRVKQRYTRLAERRYRYEGLASGFSAEFAIDERKLVRDYPQTFRRLL